MKLYHGTSDRNIKKFRIIPRKHNPPEFGDGVYFTSNYKQAEKWSINDSDVGAVYVVDVDLNELNGLDLDNCSDRDLYAYIAYLNRINLRDIAIECLDELDDKDYIKGQVLICLKDFYPLAKGFNKGKKSIEDFKKLIKVSKTFNQYCFRSEKALRLINKSIVEVKYTHK